MDVIEILSDDDDAPAPVRAEIDEEEDSQEVCFLSTTPAPRKASPELHRRRAGGGAAAPRTLSGGRPSRDDAEEDVVEVVNPDELSGKAKDALLKSLLAEKQAMARKVDAPSRKKHKEHEKKQSTRPVYWRRDGAGKRLVDDGSRGKTVVDLVEGSDEYASVASVLSRRHPRRDDPRHPPRAQRRSVGPLLRAPGEDGKDMGGGESMIFQHDVLPGVAPRDHGRDGRGADFADQSSYSDQYCRMPDHSAEATAARGRGGPRGRRTRPAA
ncbi:hypothetical protein JL720_17221 [Aureococcus anophagefferens]|nr:hypothetical protein JL720_17221 [Aureococcus anophagefferens]